MGATNFDSLIVGGVPFVPGQPGNANIRGQVPGGKVYYVSSTTGSPGNGLSIDAPLTTVFGANGAVAKIANRTNSGDVIFVLPGHTESISSADHGSHWGTASGFSIVGLGTGTMRPTFTWTTATSTLLIDTANVEIANCRLLLAGSTTSTTALTVAAPITISAAGCRIVGNYIQWGVDADQIVGQAITTTAAADDLVFANNMCEAAAAAVVADTKTFLQLIGCDRAIIRNNFIVGGTTTITDGLIEGVTTASTNIVLEDNFIYNAGSGCKTAVDFGTALAHTGSVQRNTLVVDLDGATGAEVFTVHGTANFALLDNFLVNNNNERGLVIGTASV